MEGAIEPQTGMVINLVELDNFVQPVLDDLDHTHLDQQHPFFRDHPSTAENVVAYLWQRLYVVLGSRLCWIKLWETPNNIFEYGVREP